MMFSFTLIKEPCPPWLSFFLHCWQNTYHPGLYRIIHTSTDFASWASVMHFGQKSSIVPFPNLVLLSGWQQHQDTPLAPLVAHQGRGHTWPCLVAEEMKPIHYAVAESRQKRPRQTVTGHAEPGRNFWDTLPVCDSCPVRPESTRVAFSLPPSFSPSFPFYSQICPLSV
jgi:hypothetical protein